jgi:hypothetical protein
MPAFYNHPEAIDDIVDHFIARVLDQFGLASPAARRWSGLAAGRRSTHEQDLRSLEAIKQKWRRCSTADQPEARLL